jgi:hypothetical protein
MEFSLVKKQNETIQLEFCIVYLEQQSLVSMEFSFSWLMRSGGAAGVSLKIKKIEFILAWLRSRMKLFNSNFVLCTRAAFISVFRISNKFSITALNIKFVVV